MQFDLRDCLPTHWWSMLLTGIGAVSLAHLAGRAYRRTFAASIRDAAAARRRHRLESRVVLITGASSGLGRALAFVAHAAGARLVLTARSLDKLSALCHELTAIAERGTGPFFPPLYRYLDLADVNGVEATIGEIFAMYGRVDVLVNNAGQSYRGAALATEVGVFRALMETNFFGHVRVTQTLLARMETEPAAGEMVVVGVSSLQGRLSIPYRTAYSASKHAFQAYFDGLRAELAASPLADRVKICVVSPGYIRTSLSLNAVTGSGARYGRLDETTAAGMDPGVAAERIIDEAVVGTTPDEIILDDAWKPRAAIWMRVVAPTLYFRTMAKRAIKERAKYE